MENVRRDFGYAIRTLRRNPGFALVAILTLALGIGATTAIFSVVSSVLLRPLPYRDQDRLAVVWESQKTRGYGAIEVSYLNYKDWRDRNRAFESLAIVSSTNQGMTLSGDDEPVQVMVATVSSNFFQTLGVAPLLGRTILPEEDLPGAARSAVLSHALWQQHYGSDPGVLGRQIRLDGESYTVAGVLPSRIEYPSGAQIWVPVVPVSGPAIIEDRVFRVYKVIGRLKPGITFTQAQKNLEPIALWHEKQYPETNEGFGVFVGPLTQEVLGNVRPTLLILLAAVGLVLLIAASNVANLLLARTMGRRQEIGVRSALGADRRRLVAQLLIEGLVLGLVGGALGLLLASLGLRSLLVLAPKNIPRLDEIGIDGISLLFTLGISFLTVAIFGLTPAFQAARTNLSNTLREGSKRTTGSVRSRRLRSSLVVAEVALALVLLVGAGLMIQTVRKLQDISPGFEPANVLTLRVKLPEKNYPEVYQRQAFFDRFIEQIETLPGVVSAATVLQRPLEDVIGWDMPYAVEGQSDSELFKNPYANLEAVSPEYFETMRIPLLRGRAFTPADDEKAAPVVIVGRSLAERSWPGQNPIGKRIRRVIGTEMIPWATVVGVAEDVRYRGWDKVTMDFYVPAKQNPFDAYIPYRDIVIRTQGDPLALAPSVRKTVYGLDPNQSVASLTTMDALVARALAGARFTMALMGIFSALAVLLAAIGLYGLLSYAVSQRSHEIGIRMALGARREEILTMVMAHGMKLALTGLAAGLLAAFLVTRFMRSLLYEVSAADPATFLLVPLILALVALLATLLPAWRATRASPITVLRSE